MRILHLIWIFLICSFNSFSQLNYELKGDTIYVENEKCAYIVPNGTGWKVNGIDGKWSVQIKDGGFKFSIGKEAYPEVTSYSKERAVQTLKENTIIKKGGGLDLASVEKMVRKFPVQRSTLPVFRINPICQQEE